LPDARAPASTEYKNKPLVRKAGARQRLAQVTVTWTVW